MTATYRGRRLTGFYRVPRDLVLSDLWRRLTAHQRSVAMVLLSLADHATGSVVVSYAELAILSGAGRGAARGAISALIAAGFISPTENTPEAGNSAHLWTQQGIAYTLRNPSWFGEPSDGQDIPDSTPETREPAQGVLPQTRGVLSETSSPYMEKEKREPRPSSPEALRAADSLLEAILKWKPDHRLAKGLPTATREGWAKEIDLLHRKDGVSWERITAVIAWLPSDDFWPANVQSGATLRKQFDKLEAKMRRGQPRRASQGTFEVLA